MTVDPALLLSTLAVALSTWAVYCTRAVHTRNATLHLQYRQAVRAVRERSQPHTLTLLQNPEVALEAHHARDVIGEDLLCVYEEACAAYLDRRLDPRVFRALWDDEVRQLIEGQRFRDRFDAPTPFTSILQVYAEWNPVDPVQVRLNRGV